MPVWDAEVEIDAQLVRALLAERFPELDAASARPLAEGWDFAVWVVEERLAFRFPRREIALTSFERELTILPRLAPVVDVPIPIPVHVEPAGERFSWPFSAFELLPGREAADAGLDDAARTSLAPVLAGLLRALHDPSACDVVDHDGVLPFDPLERADMRSRVPRAREWLDAAARLGIWRAPDRLAELLREASELGPPGEPGVVVHGDFHARHVLVDDDGTLTGVIDWGDCCRGDPAIDLQLYWSFLPPAGRERFLRSYGPVDDERLLRARVVAAFLCAALAVHARETGLRGLEREAVGALERTLVD